MWAQVINILLGLLITISPGTWNFSKIESDQFHVTGPLIISLATIALWEVNRNVRIFNIFTGAWLIVAPFLWSYGQEAFWISVLTGMLVIGFSFIKGKIKKRYGGGWRSLFQKNPLHDQQMPSQAPP